MEWHKSYTSKNENAESIDATRSQCKPPKRPKTIIGKKSAHIFLYQDIAKSNFVSLVQMISHPQDMAKRIVKS